MNNLFAQIDHLQNQINEKRPFDVALLKAMKEYFRIGLTYTSNALEGNSLTESETKIVLEEGITIGGKRLVDHLEAVGHSQAYDYIYTLSQKKIITQDDIKALHHLFYCKIDERYAGVYRNTRAYITGSKYPLPDPDQLPGLMESFIDHIIELRKTKHPVEVAALAHKEFVFIHPFVDGNGRVARLLMNLLLFQEGYSLAVIPPIVRSEYIHLLEKAHVADQDFILFIGRCVKETQQDVIRIFFA